MEGQIRTEILIAWVDEKVEPFDWSENWHRLNGSKPFTWVCGKQREMMGVGEPAALIIASPKI